MSNARPADIFNLCRFQYANGRLCGLPAHPKGDGLCLAHFRRATAEAKPKPREDDLSAELASPVGDFITQIDINHVLGKLFDALAANRCSARRATSLAYIACLLTQTQKAAKDEARSWDINIPIFKKLLEIKYPNRPVPGKKPATAKSRATPPPAESTLEPSPVPVA